MVNFYILISFLSGVFFALNGLSYKISNKYSIQDPMRLLFFVYLWQVPFSVLLAPFTRIYFDFRFLWPFIFYLLSFFLGSVLVGLAVQHLDASVFMPLFNFQIVFTSFFAYLFLGESY